MFAEERKGKTFSSHSCSSARPVSVCKWAIREIIIDHVCHMAEIQASACNPGGYDHFELLFLKSIEKRGPLRLVHAPMYYVDRFNFLLQFIKQVFAIPS